MTQNPIELTNIASELTRLFDEAQGENKIRACLFNLIIYTQKSQRDRYYQELIRSVISKYPCRVMLITSDDRSQSDSLRTSVTTETVGEGERKLICEIIHIEVSGQPHERVPYIILPHILPDLPVYLLWTQDPSTESIVLPKLEPLATRIIFDSEASPNLQNFSNAVLPLIDHFHCQIGDLNWSALSGWRNLFAQTFDSPRTVQHLKQSRRIEIHYHKQPIEAAYFQAWLAAQLGWSFEKVIQEGTLSYGATQVVLVPEDKPELPSGILLSVEIESQVDGAHYMFKRHPETRQVYVQFSDNKHCDLPYYAYLPGLTEGQEIIQEIFYPQPGAHYRNMLTTLSHISWRTS